MNKKIKNQVGFVMQWLAIVIFIGYLILLTGCRAKQATVAVELRDSITERVVHHIKIDTVEVPMPRQSIEVTTFADSSTLLTDVAESRVWIMSDGSLRHTLRNLPGATLKVPVAVSSDSVISRGNHNYNKSVEVERELTRWERAKMELGGLAMGALAIGIVAVRVWLWRRVRR